MALIALVYSRAQGSTLGLAKILSFTIIPVFIIGPLAGVYVDKWDRRRTMYACDFLRAALVFTIPFFLFSFRNLVPIYIVIFLVFAVGRFFVTAKLAIIPDIVEKEELLIANSLVNTTGMIAAILGFGASGVLVDWLGAKSGFYLDAFSFLVSALFIFMIAAKAKVAMDLRRVGKDIVDVIRKSVFQEIKEGAVYFIKRREIRFAAGVMFLLWSALGAIYIVLIVFVQNTLDSAVKSAGTKDLGLLIMFLGVGLFVGSMLYGRLGQRVSHYKTIFASLALSGVMLVVFALVINAYRDFGMAAWLALALGLAVSPIMIATNTIVHKVSDNEMMGKIFSSLEIIMHLGFILFMFLSSMLAERIPEVAILVAVGCVLAALGVINFVYHRKIPWLD